VPILRHLPNPRQKRSATYARPGVLFSILQKGLRASDRLNLKRALCVAGRFDKGFPDLLTKRQ
jgi:hypothetical protein